MSYSKIQKFLSSLVLFSILFSITVRVPFYNFSAFAGSSDFYDIVSVIVEEEIYDDIKMEVNRYAADIEGVLDNTKVIILPTPKDTDVFNIASVNEALYFEWYKWVEKTNFESKLVWTVIVGDIGLPVVYDGNNSSKTILPFVDFEDKAYIYNHSTKKYEKNSGNANGLQAEIWHGLISPNFWDDKKNLSWLKDYFDKNHDYYEWTGNFDWANGLINWNIWEGNPVGYDPNVFYFDAFRESKALNYNSFVGYKWYLENKEDIVYNRFSNSLAEKLKDQVLWNSNDQIWDLLQSVAPDLDAGSLSQWPDLSNTPDIQSRHVTQKIAKKFIEIFAGGALWDFRKNVHNAWRYNWIWAEVNMDMIPYFVTVLDSVNDEVIKDVTSELENKIDDLVKTELQEDIYVPTILEESNAYIDRYRTSNNGSSRDENLSYIDYQTNILYWIQASNITDALQCSIYRGATYNWWTLVEANRWLNISLVTGDVALLENESISCLQAIESWDSLNWYWGKNTWLNLDSAAAWTSGLQLKEHDLNGSIQPLFDLVGSRAVDNTDNNPSYLDCFDNNFFVSREYTLSGDNTSSRQDRFTTLTYGLPISGNSAVNWSCKTVSKKYDYTRKYNDLNAEWKCSDEICVDWKNKIFFKKIPSYIEHKSPTVDELKIEIESGITPSLPIDRDRYIDFQWKGGNYKKINYPYLFRLTVEEGDELSTKNIEKALTKYLDSKKSELWDFDLVNFLKSKEDQSINIWWETKTLSYYDTLIFAIYWNNLNTVSSKYKFVFENYLSDQLWSDDDNFYLAKNKKQYELAYIWAPWDAQNMYVKLDPEEKAENPYSEVLSKNSTLSTQLLGSNIWISENLGNEWVFQCAPPEWVPIFEWVPALVCWIWNMLPPTISISDWVCGPSLLSADERQEIFECSGDVNKNGINDCIENKLQWGSLELKTSSDKYYYNKSWSLTSQIKDKNWKVVKLDSASEVHFELVKLEIKKDKNKELTSSNTEVIYDTQNKNNFDLTKEYIYFKNGKAKVALWEVNYAFVSKNEDVNAYFKASVETYDNQEKKEIFLESEEIQISVRGERLFTSSYKVEQDNWWVHINVWENSVKVSDKINIFLVDKDKQDVNDISKKISFSSVSSEKMILSLENISDLGKTTPISYPIALQISRDGVTLDTFTVHESEMWEFKNLASLEKSWTYTFEIQDNDWFISTQDINLIAEEPSDLQIQLWSTLIEAGWNITTNIISILDKFWNPVIWEFLDLDIDIDGAWLLFEENEKDNISLQVLEWYKVFRLQSTGSEWTNTIKVNVWDGFGKTLASAQSEIQVLDKIQTVLKPLDSNIRVGGNSYKYELSLRDSRWKILSNFNSRVYLGIQKNYGSAISPYVEIKGGRAELEFKTATIAWEVPFEFQIEWLWRIITKNITILPDAAIKIDMSLSKSKIEASKDEFSLLKVELKDRYWNIVRTDNTTNTKLEILDQYKNIISWDILSQTVQAWVSTYKIFWTENPWTAYFKISTNPWLENNGFVISDGAWEITVQWVWENMGKIETFYFWNAQRIQDTRYNALYTTLLGAPYWDVTQEDYLAWSLLFQKDNRSLAVSSLLNSPYWYSDIIDINPEGWIKFVYNDSDVTQDIESSIWFDENNLFINLFNASLSTYLWKVYFNFPSDTNLQVCEGTSLSICEISSEKTSISLQSNAQDYSAYLDWDLLILQDKFWKKILDIDSSGHINKYWIVDFVLRSTNNGKYLDLDILSWDTNIGSLWFHFVDANINVSRDQNKFENKIKNLKNSILVLLSTNSYQTRDSYNWDQSSKIIYYNDPFSTKYSLNNFTKNNSFWYENFAKKWWLWWSEENKTLLNFAAWKSVWESIKDYSSFSVVNLWDPVLQLKKSPKKLPKTIKDRKFDRTIWNQLTWDKDILSYQVFDYNADEIDDILLIKNNNYFKLLENTLNDQKFLDTWNLAYISDLGNKDLVKTWDFTWDNYEDIFFVNKNGDPFLLNNQEKDFVRISLKDQFQLEWKIIRVEKFDMDNDKITDLVILDDSWEIHIFYWTLGSWNPEFKKLLVSDSYWIKLSSEIRSDNGFIYFDGLSSVESSDDYNADLLKDNEEYLRELQKNINSNSLPQNTSSQEINEWLVDKLIYVTASYWTSDQEDISTESVLWNINLTSSAETSDSLALTNTTLSNFINSNDSYVSLPARLPITKQTSFIKSDYSSLVWLDVEKKFIDRNEGFLKSDDVVDVEIVLKNTSNQIANNVVYLEKLDQIFTLNTETIRVSSDANIAFWVPWYDFVIDNFSLVPGWTITINYETKTKALKYGYLKVWLFEKGELWDDFYGDIIIKKNNQNCSQPQTILKSQTKRTYTQWVKEVSCDENKNALPDEIEKNTEDSDNNGIPDYIDNLTDPNNIDAQAEYAKNALADVNKWAVSEFDDSPNIVWDLSEMNANIDETLDKVDNILQGFSCGFWWWGCIATPLNWAPLAPGWDPTLFWVPVWDGLQVGEWLPIFSALTWFWIWPLCLPIAVWPPSPLWPGCWATLWAWGYLWTMNPTNFFRLFITPTLTWWMWTAMCFGAPPMLAWYANMPWLSPLLPGWNCIVTAAPLGTCSDDGSDWYVAWIWESDITTGSFGLINWNCSPQVSKSQTLDSEFVQDYLQYKTTGYKSDTLFDRYKESFTKISENTNGRGWFSSEPLLSINWEWNGDQVDIAIDFSAGQDWDFSDVLQIQQTRISPFPDFLMWWVTRQIEEIVTKLTDFPTVFVILPDLQWVLDSGILDGWDNKAENREDAFVVNKNIANITWTGWINTVNSWIKEAYNYMSNIPLIQIEQEVINISVPYPEEESINRTLKSWGNTVDNWTDELERAKWAWTLWAFCSWTWAEKSRCEQENAIWEKILIDTQGLISSLERNIDVLNDYKTFPEKLGELVNKKQDYLEQILCNVESISWILGGRIWKNGKRFKAWVEAYVLIKAILKSWQVLIDVFIDYEAECHECKNERGDLMTYIWKLISVIIPKIPVIQFPKWPDVIIDLHNIRASLSITLPEFQFTTRPILLPTLPDLILPDVPTVNITLPELPVLPTLEIPELPDLPTLPTVELPNLPPAPTLPKMFASLEWVLDILKLVTKAMCILKTSPFVPEWRAWDQIAFLTERQWYLPTDFIDINLPQFSFPFVDAIKITSYVNLEFETDFILELARQVAMPINWVWNNFTQMLDIEVSDLDFSILPSSVDINIWSEGIEGDISQNSQNKKAAIFATLVVKWIWELYSYLETNKNETVSNDEFKQLIFTALSSKSISSNPKLDNLRSVWKEVESMTYSKEDKIIEALEKNNFKKFELLKEILSTEIQKTKEQEKNLQKFIEPSYITQVAFEQSSDVKYYNEKLRKYNEKFITAATSLQDGNGNEQRKELKQEWDRLLSNIKTPLSQYAEWFNNNSLSAVTSTVPTTSSSTNSCSAQSQSAYHYNYKGLYVLEDNISYRLFDYLDELDGNEVNTLIDFDNDSDDDLIYMTNGQIFIKENLNNSPIKRKTLWWPIVIESDDNKFYDTTLSEEPIFYESVNNFEEVSVDNSSINMRFSKAAYNHGKNYRVEFYDITDKFLHIWDDSYFPKKKKKYLIDAFANRDEITYVKENETYKTSKNLAYIKNIWILKGIKLQTKNLINIKDSLEEGKIVNISPLTKLYAWRSSFVLKYLEEWSQELQWLVVAKHQNIEMKQAIKVIWITWDAYIKGTTDIFLEWEEIRWYLHKPLFAWTWIKHDSSIHLSEKPYVDIMYYDDTEVWLDFNEINDYKIYDLWSSNQDYLINVSRENDYYYSKIRTFKEWVFGTYSKPILLSPQKEADSSSPELSLWTVIRVPVYQKKIIDITENIYEDSWIRNINEVRIDMDLSVDSDWDGNPKNDADNMTSDTINVAQSLTSIQIEFGAFETLFKRNIWITLVDNNNNASYTEAPLEVYAPNPEIQLYNNNIIQWSLDEELTNEPVHLYRYRWWTISKLENIDGEDISLTNNGIYDFDMNIDSKNLLLTQNDLIIAEIDENTWKIDIKNPLSQIEVLSSNDINNDSAYPKMTLQKGWEDVYYQYLQFSSDTSIQVVSNFDDLDNEWMYVQFTNGTDFNYYQIPEWSVYAPWSLSIYRITNPNKDPLFTFFKDGRINTWNEFYRLEYSTYGDYIVLKLIDKNFNKEVAKVLFKVDWEYVMK